ncbi:unnamed protein product [Allacma fusca]|uniref:Uncharacterized protein n=1 Tax=Allacma fusca TaxID=39272 RepID=A0A8J2J3Z6_9HEXA|nr:unnamed protein product [Allacma fusca]
MKLSNFLDTALTDLQNGYCHFSVSGPSRVVGNTSEVFSSQGNKSRCFFLCSFEISKVLRLTIEYDVWMMMKERSKIPLELFVTHENLLVQFQDQLENLYDFLVILRLLTV